MRQQLQHVVLFLVLALALSASAWPKLTNNLLLTNGVGRVLDVEGGPSRRYFIVREPQ